jgi:hypothetical protein
MDGARRKSNRILTVERGFEWSRIEEQVMASAYEQVLPHVRAAPREPLAGQAKVEANGGHGSASDDERYAKGA